MLKWQTSGIKGQLDDLCEITNCNSQLVLIVQRTIAIGVQEKHALEAIQIDFDRSKRFYEIVMTKEDSFELLIDALDLAKQTGAVRILKDIKAEWERSNQSTVTPQQYGPSPVATEYRPRQRNEPVPVAAAPGPGPSRHGNWQASAPLEYGTTEQNKQLAYRMVENGDVEEYCDELEESKEVLDFSTLRKSLVVFVENYKKPDDYYKLNQTGNHHALILNFTKFQNPHQNRRGAYNDTNYMRDLWTQLGYSVTVQAGEITRSDLNHILNEFTANFRNKNRNNDASCVVFIGSHGCIVSQTGNGKCNGCHKILTSDMILVDFFEDIMHKFNSRNCPGLEGMPKLFLVSACQGFLRDGVGDGIIKNVADTTSENPLDHTLVCFSSTPGFLSYRSEWVGTWFIYCLSKVFMENAYEMDVHALLKKTQDTMRNIKSTPAPGQLCAILDLGLQKLHFNVKPFHKPAPPPREERKGSRRKWPWSSWSFKFDTAAAFEDESD